MNARLRRAGRLVDLATQRVDAARARLADARRLAAEAKVDVDRCEGAWCTVALAPAQTLTRAEELERQSAHLRTLRLRVDAAVRRAAEAVVHEARADEALLDAVKHRRKLELWSERLVQAEQENSVRTEARAADELAARTVRHRT